MDAVLAYLMQFEYLAMFVILLLCGLGLPVPEEVTLVGSGLLVGWGEAQFGTASAACVAGILCGDSLIFGLGHHFGRRFLESRPMRFVLTHEREVRVQAFFAKHKSKALFLARFFPGVRIGVYAYAGSQRVPWGRFLALDFLGAMISGPTSISIGAWAARALASDRDEAVRLAVARVREFGLSVIALVCVGIGIAYLISRARHRSDTDS